MATVLANVALLPARGVRWVKLAMWTLALIPFARLAVGVAQNSLGANPIETITRTTGWYALVLLCVTLAVTPARKLLGWPWLMRLRRPLGLFAFFYAALHFTTWVWFDHFFDLGELARDVVKRPFVLVGFSAFVLMLPLALTSTQGMMRRLGGRRWQALHRSVYAVASLGVLHFWWLRAGKHNFADPANFALIIAILLGARLWWRYSPRWFARVAIRQ